MEINYRGLIFEYHIEWHYDSWGEEFPAPIIDSAYHEEDKERKYDFLPFLLEVEHGAVFFDKLENAIMDEIEENRLA